MLLDGSYFGHHMMDWDLAQMIPMIFGGITIIIAIIVILYIIIESNRSSYKISQLNTQTPIGNHHNLKRVDYREDKSEEINFCFNCGVKLDREQLQYCPSCGTKL